MTSQTRNARLLALGGALAAVLAAPAHAGVTVKFTDADKYVDMPFSQSDREDVLKEIQAHFTKLAKRLPAGQDLTVEVTEIDLAGTIEPARHSGRDLRILKGAADWPRIEFKYSVNAQGKALNAGEAKVVAMNYLRDHNPYPSNEPLRYEKRMLDRWFRDTFEAAKAK